MRHIKIAIIGFLLFQSTIFAKEMTGKCTNNATKTDRAFLSVGQECVEYFEVITDNEDSLNIIVHGTWKKGTDILNRYSSFAEDLAIQTDITTVAIALPGYSGSSTNYFQALSHDKAKSSAYTKKYVDFLSKIIEKLQKKYSAKTINFIGHSAGGAMGATLIGYKPKLIKNLISIGGYYNIHKAVKDKNLISATDFINSVDKSSKILLIYGEKDKISKPEVSIEFYKIAKKQGLLVKLVEVKNGIHLDLDMSDTSIENIVEFLL